MGIAIDVFEPGIFQMLCTQKITGDELKLATQVVERLLAQQKGCVLLVDCMKMEGFSADIAVAAQPYLAVLKRHGIKQGAAATTSNSIRMLGSTIALAGGFRLKFFATRLEAIMHTKAILAESRSSA